MGILGLPQLLHLPEASLTGLAGQRFAVMDLLAAVDLKVPPAPTSLSSGLRLAPSELERFAAALHALGARPSVVIFTRVPSADEV